MGAILGTYACILFSGSRLTGLLLLVASAFEPRALLCGLFALGVATSAIRILRLEAGPVATSPYGYNVLFAGLGAAHWFESTPAGRGSAGRS